MVQIGLPKRETCSKSEERNPKKNGVCETQTSQISCPGKVDGQITRSIAKNKNRFSKLYQLFEGHFRDVPRHLPLKTFKNPLFRGKGPGGGLWVVKANLGGFWGVQGGPRKAPGGPEGLRGSKKPRETQGRGTQQRTKEQLYIKKIKTPDQPL